MWVAPRDVLKQVCLAKQMKAMVLILLMIAIAARATPDGRAPTERPRLTDELRRKVTEDSPPTNPTTTASVETPVVLSPVRVTSSYEMIDRKPVIDLPKEQPFNWKEGGTLYRHKGRRFTTEFKFQFNPLVGKFDIFRISW